MFHLSFLLFAVILHKTVAIDLAGCAPGPPKEIHALFHSEGDIKSPGYDENAYPNDKLCIYTITAPFGTRIRVSFVHLDIDPFDLCMKDKLAIHDGPDVYGPVHGVFCGSEKPNDIISLGNAITLVFQSDFLTGRKGFHIRYSVRINDVLCPGQSMCHNRKCFTFSDRCNGRDDCGDGTDEENCFHPLPSVPCGNTPITPLESEGLDRIIGGREAKPGSWPWQVDLQLSWFHPNGHMCGGTLINAEWVLSAAHCFQRNGRAEEWRIHLGNHNKFKSDDNEQIRYAKRIIVYPGYTGDHELQEGRVDFEHDIALVKLNAPVKFTNQVQPACLPKRNEDIPTGKACIATGWGMTRGTGFNDVLKQVVLHAQSSSKCENNMIPFAPKSMICVRNNNGLQDVCHGDSGGPLVCKSGTVWNLMGATSFGTVTSFQEGACALPGAHTVYTKVSDKIDWITNMIQTYDD